MNRRYTKHTGFTLLEILVTLVILAVGLLGLMATQSNLMQTSVDNSQRSLMVYIGNELLERIRANADANNALVFKRYKDLIDGTALDCNDAPRNCQRTELSGASSCSAIEIANYDVWQVLCPALRQGNELNVNGAIDYVAVYEAQLDCVSDSNPDNDGLDCDPGTRITLTLDWASRTIDENGETDFGTSTLVMDSRL